MVTKKTKVVTRQEKLTVKQQAENIAKLTLLPSANAAAVIAEYAKPFGEQDIAELIEVLRPQMKDVHGGDLQHCESMLVGQANALQSIFVSLARRAVSQDYLKQYETYLRLALKAQNQSRMTLETLAAIKNPPVVFAKQANIAHGHQQVNNGTPTPASHAGENKIHSNELLEVQNGSETLDTSATGTTIGKDKAMATLD